MGKLEKLLLAREGECAKKAIPISEDREYWRLHKQFWKAKYSADSLTKDLPSFDAMSHFRYCNAVDAVEKAKMSYRKFDDYVRESNRGTASARVKDTNLKIFLKKPGVDRQVGADHASTHSSMTQTSSRELNCTFHEGPCPREQEIAFFQKQHELNLREIVCFDELHLLSNAKNDQIPVHGVSERGVFKHKLGCQCDKFTHPPPVASVELAFQNLPLSPVEFFRCQAPRICQDYYRVLREQYNVLFVRPHQKAEIERSFLHGALVGQWGVAYNIGQPHAPFSLSAQNTDLEEFCRCAYRKIIQTLGMKKQLRELSSRTKIEVHCFSSILAGLSHLLHRVGVSVSSESKAVIKFQPISSYDDFVQVFRSAGIRIQEKDLFFHRIFKHRAYRVVCSDTRTVLITYFKNRSKLRIAFYYQPVVA